MLLGWVGLIREVHPEQGEVYIPEGSRSALFPPCLSSRQNEQHPAAKFVSNPALSTAGRFAAVSLAHGLLSTSIDADAHAGTALALESLLSQPSKLWLRFAWVISFWRVAAEHFVKIEPLYGALF